MDRVTFLNDEFENSATGEKVEGVTVIVDGKLRDILDDILAKNSDKYSNITEIIRDALFMGLENLK